MGMSPDMPYLINKSAAPGISSPGIESFLKQQLGAGLASGLGASGLGLAAGSAAGPAAPPQQPTLPSWNGPQLHSVAQK